ncbi:hypothetical protein [Stenotrophomonas maltophilia]|uniref:hypothetical protein n=1 Tax=Stenotrophomonas maltophilia TaxID=40324 RepID=UPI00163B4D8A|nr:hypothetical protein [Stenotrophomonas maltophilia]
MLVDEDGRGQNMEFLDALSPCWSLGPNCVPRWEAWAVVVAAVAVEVAYLAIGATVFLGLMTLKLGQAANRATAAALAVAEGEANARQVAEENERLMILSAITPEISFAETKAHRAIDTLQIWGWSKFSKSEKMQQWAFESANYFSFPVCESYKDRIHLLGQPFASKLVRAIGIGRTLKSFEFDYTQGRPEDRNAHFFLLIARLQAIELDASEVSAECVRAGEAAGIRIRVGDIDPK